MYRWRYDSSMSEPGSEIERRHLWTLVVLLVAASVVVVPLLPWIVLSLWLGLYTQRIHRPLTKRLGGRSGLAATLTVSLLLVIALPIAAVVTSIILDLIVLVQRLMESEQAQAMLVRLVQGNGGGGGGGGGEGATGAALGGGDTKQMLESAQGAIDLVMAQGERAWAIVRQIAGVAAEIVIGLLVMVTGMYGVLVEGPAWYKWYERHAPMTPAHLARYGAAFIETGRGLWFGIVGAGMIQSIVATIAYLVIGVPSALALGMLTLLFSVIPAIGTALVWVPVAAGLALTGRTTAAIALGAVGVVVIGSVDNVARPYLARRGKLQLPTWMVLIGMFGGIALIGGWGLLLGPLVLRLAKEALLIRASTRESARSPILAPSGSPADASSGASSDPDPAPPAGPPAPSAST
jgi:predicted PurR-regulated permease PerM